MDIKKFFLHLLNSELDYDVSSQILDLKIEESSQNIKIISVIDTELVPKIRQFASQIDKYQTMLAKKLGKKKVSIMFSAKSSKLTSDIKQRGALKEKHALENVDKIIMVASGKGGVGKSTIASLIALYLSKIGMKIGLLDADIYGPSVPHIFGISSRPEIEEGKFFPHIKHEIELMSAGFLIEQGSAAIWRGPMVNKALHQMMAGTCWGMRDRLDYLIIDTPPGTGDTHISLLEKYQIDGAIVVTTPSALAINDVKKSINLLNITGSKVFCVVSNMGHILLENSKRLDIFNTKALQEFSKDLSAKMVEIPMLQAIAANSEYEVMLKEIPKLEQELKSICEAL